jgi:hypothetical protein
MFRFLIPPFIFLLLKNFAITSNATAFTYFSTLTAEDASQRDALVASIVFILITAFAAAVVVRAVVFSKVLFKRAENIIYIYIIMVMKPPHLLV